MPCINQNVKFNYIIVGSGLTGAVIARSLKDAGKSVLVLERRDHIAGNIHDSMHHSGVRIHTYGPHYFRTNSNELWHFVNRFASFYRYEPELKSLVDDRCENWPIAGSYIKRTVGKRWEPAFRGQPKNFEQASLQQMPQVVYEKFVKGYTEKQWGVPANTLTPKLAKRFDVRSDDDPRLTKHTHQGIPKDGYNSFMQKMLEGIPVFLNTDYLQNKDQFIPTNKLIFTGPIDEYFNFELGKLKYRGQQRVHEYHPEENYIQPCGQINNPNLDTGAHIRTLEWKHMMDPQHGPMIRGTVVTKEIPFTPVDPSEYEYPFPDEDNASLYQAYRERADAIDNLLICGRLGEYRYYDMDQAIARARVLAKRLIDSV